jgi:hypothetical protein
MASLGDLLSQSSKQNLLYTIQPGGVFRMKLTTEEGIII